MTQRLTRHNGRSNKNGVYKADHNDRRFNIENADHINPEMTECNIYWDCYSGIEMPAVDKDKRTEPISFSEAEKRFYTERYSGYLSGQHERNAKSRHTERDRTIDDILADKRYCPEETIYQIGTIEDSIQPGILLEIGLDFVEQLKNRFGEHIHIIDWALHNDEGTPHIHERHVFDFTNRYGEIQPGQDKALEALGFERPDLEKKPSKYNSRKMTFDATCRAILFDICKSHGVYLEEEPAFGGRAYLEKQDYILMKQKEKLKSVNERIDDSEALLDEVVNTAYEKAVNVIAEKVVTETQRNDINQVNRINKWAKDKYRNKPWVLKAVDEIFDSITRNIRNSSTRIINMISEMFHDTEVIRTCKKEIKEEARPSVMSMLQRAQNRADEYNRSREKPKLKLDTEMSL